MQLLFNSKGRFRSAITLLSLALVSLESMATATVFRVTPVTIDVRADGAASAITVTNPSDHQITIQSRIFRWTQSPGGESLDPSDAVVASPPMATIPAGQSHVIRVVRVTPARAEREEAYRIWIDEVPDPRNNKAGEVTLLLRQSIPVFFGSSSSSRAQVAFRIERTGDGWKLVATNSGNRRLRLNDLVLRNSDGGTLESRVGLFGYVLAGTSMSWPLRLSTPGKGPLTVSASSDQGPVEHMIRDTHEF